MGKISDKERLASYKSLGLTPEEEKELLEYDKAVDAGRPTKYDLTDDQLKIAKSYSRTGTRKTPTVYKFSKRERKENVTKGALISALDNFLRTDENLNISEITITNKERQIAFKIGEENFELTLVQKRKKGS